MSEYKEKNEYDDNTNDFFDDDFDIWDINSVISHITSNKLGFLLLAFVFVIIYIIDYISRINSMIFSMPSPVPILGMQNTIPMQVPKRKFKKR